VTQTEAIISELVDFSWGPILLLTIPN
jgi:hypothetical protein